MPPYSNEQRGFDGNLTKSLNPKILDLTSVADLQRFPQSSLNKEDHYQSATIIYKPQLGAIDGAKQGIKQPGRQVTELGEHNWIKWVGLSLQSEVENRSNGGQEEVTRKDLEGRDRLFSVLRRRQWVSAIENREATHVFLRRCDAATSHPVWHLFTKRTLVDREEGTVTNYTFFRRFVLCW